MSNKGKKALYILLASTAVVLLVYYSIRTSPIPVEIGFATEGPLRVTIDEQGETRTHDRYLISAPVAGRLLRMELHDGDPVNEGQVVAFIDPLPLSSRERMELTSRVQAGEAYRKEAEQRVAQLQAAFQQAQRERQRADSLSKDGLIPPQQLEEKRSAEAIAQKELEAARFKARAVASELAMARAGLIALSPGENNLVKLLSPVSGKILQIAEKSERVMERGTALLTIGDFRQLEVEVQVLSTDAVKIRPGAPVTVADWGGAQDLKGYVRTVEPFAFTKVSALGIEEQRVKVIVDLHEKPASLGDGYRVECRIETWSSPSVVKIPTSSLFRVQEGWNVFTVESDRAKVKSVKIGNRNSNEAEVLEGIAPGTRVILHPPNQLEDGFPVTMMR